MKKNFILTYVISAGLFLISGIVYGVLGLTHAIDFNLFNFLVSLGGIIVVLLPYPFLKIFKLEVNLLTLICYEFQIIIAMLIGTTWHMYDILPFYDTLVHAMGGLLITLICYSIFICKNRDKNISPVWIFIIVFSMSMMVGTVWEIWEFISDGILGFNTQRYANNISGIGFVGRAALMNTMTDICANTIGAIIGSVIALFIEKKNTMQISINSNIAEVVLGENEITEIIKNVSDNTTSTALSNLSNNVNENNNNNNNNNNKNSSDKTKIKKH